MIDFNKAFIDTNPFIYFLEGADGYYEIVTKFFENAYMENRETILSVRDLHVKFSLRGTVLPYGSWNPAA